MLLILPKLGEHAVISAGVVVAGVAVVASLHAFLDGAISTGGVDTGRQTGVCIALVSVVTLLSRLGISITASRQCTVRRTTILVVLVSIVAGLDPGPDVAVSARGEGAGMAWTGQAPRASP